LKIARDRASDKRKENSATSQSKISRSQQHDSHDARLHRSVQLSRPS
jgi:hypothetical protein